MPAVIELTENIRYSDLLRKKDKYINLDKIKDLPSYEEYNIDTN
jgi:hypothetical protein